jgi:hypothetical protein
MLKNIPKKEITFAKIQKTRPLKKSIVKAAKVPQA